MEIWYTPERTALYERIEHDRAERKRRIQRRMEHEQRVDEAIDAALFAVLFIGTMFFGMVWAAI